MLFRRNGFGMGGGPVFGVTFYGLTGGDEIDMDEQKEHVFGSPIQFDDLPLTDLCFQAFFIRWHKYSRKDGHEIWGMKDYGGGGNYALNPFNLYSDVVTARYGTEDISLTLEHVIEPERELRPVYLSDRSSRSDGIGYLQVRTFSHSPAQQIGFTVQKN